MSITLNGTEGITLDNGSADGAQVTLASSGYSNWNLDNYSGRFRAYYNATEYFTITNTGNVGIGTSSPSYKLSAWTTGTGTTAGSNTIGQFYSNGSGYDANIRFGDNNNSATMLGYLSGNMYMYTGGAERMRIDSSGNVLIGTTSNPGSGDFKTVIDFGGNGRALALRTTLTTSRIMQSFLNGNGEVGHIDTSGTTTSYVTSSDYRLKENIAPMTGALEKVSLLKPVTYTWKVDGTSADGFIAHELAEVCPQAVSGEKDAVDDNGNPQYQGIDTSFLVATLTAAIQEQQELIKSLTSRIETLEAK